MMPSFNLVDQPWIPCLLPDERKPQDLSLRDTLTRAHEVREVLASSPLVTMALHRLLLAVLHRNFGPRDFNVWKSLWAGGRWDGKVVTEYFAQWHSRFYLFNNGRPFYQAPRLQKAVKKKKEQADGGESFEDI